MRLTIRMWNKDGYHKDVATLNDVQITSCIVGMEPKYRHALTPPIDAVRIVVDPNMFREAEEFEVIVER